MSEIKHDYAHGLARCSCGRIGLNHYQWEPSTCYPPRLDRAGLLPEAVCPHGTPLDAPHCQGCDDVRDGIDPSQAGLLKEDT